LHFFSLSQVAIAIAEAETIAIAQSIVGLGLSRPLSIGAIASITIASITIASITTEASIAIVGLGLSLS